MDELDRIKAHNCSAENNDQNTVIKSCIYCNSNVIGDAKVCISCGRYQKWYLNHLDHIGLIAAILLVVLGYLQFNEARQNRIEASRALDQAKEAKKIGDDLRLLTNLQNIIINAEIGDGESYDKLIELYDDKSNPYSKIAGEVISSVVGKYYVQSMFSASIEEYGFNLADFKTIDDVIRKYNSVESWGKKPLIHYIWDKHEWPERDRMQFLINVNQHDKSLEARIVAGKIISDECKTNIPPLDKENILKCWEEKKKKYK